MTADQEVGSRGVTLIEMLATLGLLAMLLIISAPALKAIFTFQKVAADAETATRRLEFAAETVRASASAAAPEFGIAPLRLYANAEEFLASLGTFHVMRGSAAIAFLELEAQAALYPIRASSTSGGFDFDLCGSTGARQRLDEIRHQGSLFVIGVSIDGIYALQGSINAESESAAECGGARLFTAQLKQTSKLILSTPPYPPSAANTLAIIPVRSHFVLYLDAHGTLRRFSLVTEEHQPVTHGIQQFSVAGVSSLWGNTLTWLKFDAVSESGKTTKTRLLPLITSQPPLSLPAELRI